MASKILQLQKLGEQTFRDVEKINGELFCLMYGAIVSQLIKDYEQIDEVNEQLEKMGFNIGTRLIDDFLARTSLGRCADFRETGDVLSKVAFKMFLGINAQIQNWDSKKQEYSLVLEENPLADFVELPENCKGLWYSNLYCGVIRGALHMLQMKVDCKFSKDPLRGDDSTEIKITFIGMIADEIPMGED